MKSIARAWPPLQMGKMVWPLLMMLFLCSCTTTTPPPPRPPELALPDALGADGPAIPFQAPNILGDPQLTIAPFTELNDLQSCLALGQRVYGIALQNTNVREAPTLDACRVGRIPRGTVVEITALMTTTNGTIDETVTGNVALDFAIEPVPADTNFSELALADRAAVAPDGGDNPIPDSAAGNGGSSTAPVTRTLVTSASVAHSADQNALGYVEDIQPIFQRNCIACHSAVVKQKNLQVTAYASLMAGSSSGPVVVPGNFEESPLWVQVSTGKMPLIGELTLSEKEAIRLWIEDGALEHRPASEGTTATQRATAPELPTAARDSAREEETATVASPDETITDLWLTVADDSIDPVPDICTAPRDNPQQVVSADLILPISCGVQPRAAQVQSLLQSLAIVPAAQRTVGVSAPTGTTVETSVAETDAASVVEAPAPAAVAAAAPAANAPQAGLQAAALGLSAPSDSDGWMAANGGFCVDPHFTQNDRGITALAFAPDGRLFVALDSNLEGETDPNILYDAHHPSRSIVVYDPSTRYTPNMIMDESSRITGMAYANGALFLNRAGEVGWIQDGGQYRTLAGGFAVNSQLFHANNGIAITNGYLYVSAGGVRDGYSDGPIEGIGEAGAQSVVSGGNRFAARLVRAPLDRLINEYNIELFETAARGLRNPYGLTVDPSGRLWFTDNGATNVPENVSAGDEVNLYAPAFSPPGTPEDATPYYGFPLALTQPQSWYTGPVVDLYNTSAPTGITWAFGTIFYGQYGRDPGLYRLGRGANGAIVSERIMLVWPLLALTTAPDGALWIGTGGGGLYRMVPGC